MSLRALTLRGLLMAACVLLLAGAGQAVAAWQITRFVVFEGKPSDSVNWREEEAGRDEPTFSPALIRDLESYLHAVAMHLDSLGFADPVEMGNIDSVVRNGDGQEAIRIYLYEASRSSLAWYTTPYPCNELNDRRVMEINTRTFGAGGKIRDSDYATLAHELFHAIQASSNLFRKGTCKHNKWMVEGMADAIGHYMAHTLRNAGFSEDMKSKAFIKVVGGRNYALPLNKVPDRTEETYGTSSFWRHLAEVSYANAQGKTHPGSLPYIEDYTYLVEFLQTEYTDRPGMAGDLTWLSRTMTESPKIKNSLSDIYPRFVSAFANHINTRIPSLAFVPDNEREEKWMGRAFGGGCTAVEIADPTIPVKAKMTVEANASRCFTVKQPGTRSAGLTVEVIDSELVVLEQLTIGMLDGTIVLKPLVKQHATNPQLNVATWKFPNFGPYPKTYIISNMARSPADTMRYTPTLHLSLGTWNSSMTAALTAPPPIVPPPARSMPPNDWQGPLPGPVIPTHRDQEKKLLEKAATDPIPNLKPITKLERKRYTSPPSCDLARLHYNLCGPQLVITLQLSPFGVTGDYLSLDQGAYGDFAGGMISQVPGQSPGLGGAFTTSIVEIEKALEGMEASKIRITLPRLDYGFTGNISNAEVWVSKANGGDSNYLSYGPTVYPEGQRLDRPPNGQVAIEEYSPLVLRGTFEAGLVDQANPGASEAPIVATSISGSFLITSAWMADDAFVLDEAYTKQELIENMIRITPFGTDVMNGIIGSMGAPPQALCEVGFNDAQLKAMGFTSGCSAAAGGSAPLACTCACDRQDEELNECERECYQPWKQCKVPDGEIPEDIEAQVELCRAAAIRKGLTEDQQAFTLQMFRMAPDFQRKEMLKTRWCGG